MVEYAIRAYFLVALMAQKYKIRHGLTLISTFSIGANIVLMNTVAQFSPNGPALTLTSV